MKKKYDFVALDKTQFRSRVQENFVQACMMMIGIIQGLSFSFLMANAMNYYGPGAEKLLHPLFLIYPAISFFIMILVLFFYSWFVSITYRPPSLRETLIPFFLGLFQVIPTYFLHDPKKWFLWNGVLMAMGFFGFLNTLREIAPRDFGEGYVDAYHSSVRQLRGNMAICALCSAVCFSASLVYRGGGEFTIFDWLPCALIFAILVFLGVRSERTYLQELFRIYKLYE